MAGAKVERRGRDTRGVILVGAGRVFGRLGYAATRVEDILLESNVSRATFYKYFDDKEAVFTAIEEAMSFSFMQAMDSVEADRLAAPEQVAEFLDTYLRWVLGWREVARVMWTDPTRPRAGDVIEARGSSHRVFLQLLLKLAAEMGFDTDDTLRYRGLIGATSEIAQALIESPRVSDRDIARARNTIIHLGIAVFSMPAELDNPWIGGAPAD